MKAAGSLASIAKVGSASVLGGTGIAGTGLLIHNQLTKEEDYKLKDLDKKLIGAKEAILSLSENFEVQTNTAQITIKVTASGGNDFAGDKWTCTIKGVVNASPAINLGEANNANFDSSGQKAKLQTELTKKENKEGLVKSCARNRTAEQEKSVDKLTSEVVVTLEKPKTGADPKKYEFPTESITSIIKGKWINS